MTPDPARSVLTADAELKAMAVIAKALGAIPVLDRYRVLQWAVDRFAPPLEKAGEWRLTATVPPETDRQEGE